MRFELSGLYTPQRRDVYDSNKKSTMYFYPSILSGCTIKVVNNSSNELTYRRARLELNGIVVAEVVFSYENRWNGQSESAGVATHVLSANAEYTYTLDSSAHDIDAGWGYEHRYHPSIKTTNVTFSSSGNYYLTLKLYSDYAATSLVASYTSTAIKVVAYSPVLSLVSVANGTRAFYKNETFSKGDLTVTAHYQYQVSTEPGSGAPSSAGSSDVTNSASITAPDMTTAGTKSVSVSYGGKNVSYSISVYGVSSYDTPKVDAHYKKGASKPSLTATVTYDDGTTSEESVSITGFDSSSAGEKTVEYSYTASKTGDSISYSDKTNIHDYTLSLTTTGVKKQYAYNATNIDLTNLVVKRVWGNGISDETISSNKYTASFSTLWDVGNNTGSIIITDNDNNASAHYDVNVDGLKEITIDTDGGRTLFGKGEQFTRSGVKVYYSEWVNGESDDKGEWSGSITQSPSTISLDEVDVKKTITLSISKNDVTVSSSYDIKVYEHTSLSLTNAPLKKYIVNGVAPKLTFGSDFKVTAICSDGLNVWNNTSPYYDVSPALNSDLVEGNNLITITSYYDANKTVVGATKTFNILVEEDYPTQDAVISYDDSLRTPQEKIILINNTVSLEHITVKVTKTNAGLTNIDWDDYDTQLILHSDNTVTKTKNDLTFNSGDTLGWYDLKITIDGVDYDDCVIPNAVCFKGLANITYNESAGDGHGYYINGTLRSATNRAKIGDSIDANNIKYRKNYSDGTHEDVFDSSLITSIKVGNNDVTTLSYDDIAEGLGDTIQLKVVINGTTCTVNVPVMYVNSLTVTNTKTAYDIHDQLDTTEISITKNYKGDSYTKSEPLAISNATLSFTGAGTGCKVSDLIPESTRMSAAVTLSFAYTEGDAPQVTATSGVTVKAIRSVALRDENQNTITKLAYEYGQTHSLSGYYLYVVFNTTETLTVVIDDATWNYANKGERIATDTAITSSVGYTYHSDTVTTSLTIHCHYLDDISVDFSSVTANTLYQYEELSVENITATKTIVSTDEDDENYPVTSDITDDLLFSFNGQNVFVDTPYLLNNTGTFNLVTSYTLNGQTRTKTQALTIYAVVLQQITLTKGASFKYLTDYYEEQYLDFTDLTINVIYNRTASNHSISYTDPAVTIVDGDGHTYNKTQQLDLDDDDVELFVKYTEGNTSVYSPASPAEGALGILSVTAKELASIRIRQAPTKTHYTYGDTFSLNGIVVEAVFNNGTSEVVSNASISLSGISSGHTFNKTDDGTTFEDKTATLSYTHDGVTKTVSLTYTLDKPVIASLKHNVNDVNEPVRKRFTDGDTFDSTGLVVKAVFSNGYEETLTSDDYTLNTTALYLDGNGKIQLHNNNQEYGSKTLTITATNPYNNSETASATYDVEVVTSGAIVSAILQLTDDYNQYFVGEPFTAKGVSFKVTDIDENVFNVTNFVTNIERGSIFRSSQRLTVTATYANGSYVKEEKFDIVVSLPNKVELTDENKYRLAIGSMNGSLFTSLNDEDGKEITFGKKYDQYGNLTGEIYPLFHEDLISVDDNPLHTDTCGYNVYTGDNAQGDMIGYIEFGIEDVRNAHIVFFKDTVNPIDGDGNIEVTFPHYVSGYADRINKCRFGKVFHNRLFVSGNPDYKSADFHSGDVNIGQLKDSYDLNTKGDYSYFSDLDYCYYGNDETAIVGYDEYRDGDLIVVKEGSRNQATLYRREYKLIEATDYAGNSVGDNLYEEAFPMFDINSNGGVGGLSHRSITNFVGETLVLTRNGLKAITNKEGVYNNSKYTFDVSTYINPKIAHEELENSILFAYDEKLILKTNRGVYVGYYEIRNENGEYEWYFLDNINADIFFECDDELFFANDNGDVCRFSIELLKYKDQERTFVGVGGTMLTIDESNDSLVVSATYASKVKEGNPFHVITEHNVSGVDQKSLIHASLGLFVDTVYRSNMIGGSMFDQTAYVGLVDRENDQIIIKPYTSDGVVDTDRLNIAKNLFYTGRKVYFDNFTGSGIYGLNKYQEYELKKINTGDDRDNVYEVYDEWGNKASLSGVATLRMSIIVNDLSITKITDISDYGSSGAKKFKLLGDHDQILDLINYDSQTYTYAGVITNEDNVKSYYETAPYAMGSIVSTKTIWSWTIVNDTALAGYMDIGYFASRKQGDYNYSVRSVPDSKGYDFSHYSWRTLDFTSRKLPATYSIQRTVPSIAYIRYLFKNFEETNIVLTSLNVVYTISNLLKGVK